ncbi:hypothetical protein FKM82_024638 [Ascaphus truei]
MVSLNRLSFKNLLNSPNFFYRPRSPFWRLLNLYRHTFIKQSTQGIQPNPRGPLTACGKSFFLLGKGFPVATFAYIYISYIYTHIFRNSNLWDKLNILKKEKTALLLAQEDDSRPFLPCIILKNAHFKSYLKKVPLCLQNIKVRTKIGVPKSSATIHVRMICTSRGKHDYFL